VPLQANAAPPPQSRRERVLAALSATPCTAKRQANKAGLKCDTHFYELPRDLMAQDPPAVVRTLDGYRLL
jgi:hypothetical protein